jgi:hypothetical protein
MRKSRSLGNYVRLSLAEPYPYLFTHPVDLTPGPIERRGRLRRSRFPAGQPTVAFDPAHGSTFLERRTAARPALADHDARDR